MPVIDAKVFNASLEKHELYLHGRFYTFYPRKITEIPEAAVWAFESAYNHLGMFVIRAGDNLFDKEKEALMIFRTYLKERVKNYQARMDQDRRNGATIKEPKAFLNAVKHISEIDEKLGIMGVVEEEASYLDSDDMDSDDLKAINLFESLSNAKIDKNKSDDSDIANKKRGRASKSYKDLDVGEDL